MRTRGGGAALALLNRDLIDTQSPSPLYFQLFTVLNDAISRGVIANGSRMPSEKEISDRFEVSRITARRTLAELAAKGLVVRHRGKGTFVQHTYQPDPIVAPLSSMLESLGHMGRDTTVTLLSKRMDTLPADLQEVFGLGAEARVCHLVRVRSDGGRAFGHYVSWTPRFDASTPRKDFEARSRMDLFKAHGIKVARVEQYLSAEGASPEIARALDVTTGKPLLKLVRFSYDASGRLQDHLTARYNSDLFSYKMEAEV